MRMTTKIILASEKNYRNRTLEMIHIKTQPEIVNKKSDSDNLHACLMTINNKKEITTSPRNKLIIG